MSNSWDDRHNMSDAAAAQNVGAHPFAHLLLTSIGLFFIVFIIWADWAVMDEVTVGEGKVIPSGQVRLVQNLEGGILSSLHVKDGDIVEKDQILLQIDPTQFRASFQESRIQYLSLKAIEARLKAEATNSKQLIFPKAVLDEQPELASNEKKLWHSRQKEHIAGLKALEKKIEQRQQDLLELEASNKQTMRRLALVREEYNLAVPMVLRGDLSKIELVRLKREVAELEAELESATLTIPRIKLKIEEAKNRVEESITTFRNRAQVQLNESHAELQKLTESITALKDKVSRTAIRSPVKGTVIRVRIHTIGQVIRSGMDLVEIMPLDDSLLVEARIRPADIAFLRVGQKAVVKISAYDFSLYGGLTGTLKQISADTITNEKGENFYKISVITDTSQLGPPNKPLPIIPGMVATTDILTGKKSVLDYLLKPILKTKQNALRER
ncbi:MAG: HlyD family type I secretion periplasmic adaptor subunit [Magnetococcales bacterium]|nr:HlyD family type I secretion periplasmic adaptor subunit [Magnetococcales bacterium]